MLPCIDRRPQAATTQNLWRWNRLNDLWQVSIHTEPDCVKLAGFRIPQRLPYAKSSMIS